VDGFDPIVLLAGSSYQTEIARATALREIVRPVTASSPRSLRYLKAVLVCRTCTLDLANQSFDLLVHRSRIGSGEGPDLHIPSLGGMKRTPAIDGHRGLVCTQPTRTPSMVGRG
jgi:hypothetical protein